MGGLPELWAAPDSWPRVRSDMMSMAEAALLVGDAILGDGWREAPEPEQLQSVAWWIGDRCRDGLIRTFALGLMHHYMPWGSWRDSNEDLELVTTGIWEEAWLGDKRLTNHVLLVRDEVTRCLVPIAPAPLETAGIHLSPYLRLMIAVAQAENVSPICQPKKNSIMETIDRLAPAFGFSEGDIGATMRQYLGTFVREVEGTKGRAATKGRARG